MEDEMGEDEVWTSGIATLGASVVYVGAGEEDRGGIRDEKLRRISFLIGVGVMLGVGL